MKSNLSVVFCAIVIGFEVNTPIGASSNGSNWNAFCTINASDVVVCMRDIKLIIDSQGEHTKWIF